MSNVKGCRCNGTCERCVAARKKFRKKKLAVIEKHLQDGFYIPSERAEAILKDLEALEYHE